jgi:hypothetical protein
MNPLHVPRVYIETSVWNFALTDDAPADRDVTREFFDQVRQGKFEAYISNVVLGEVNKAPEPRHTELLNLINEIAPAILPTSEEASALAAELINSGAIPAKHENDAAHIATAVVANMDLLLSWNFKHIVRSKTRTLVTAISRVAGYKDIEIVFPREVIYDDQD